MIDTRAGDEGERAEARATGRDENASVAVAEREASRLQLERDAARALLEQLWSSRTWRLTRPLRALARALRLAPAPRAVLALVPSVDARDAPLDTPAARDEVMPTAEFASLEAASPAPPLVAVCDGVESEAHHDARPDIICFANIDWSARFQRPQQMMAQFTAHGFRVFYVVPSRRPAAGVSYSIEPVAPGVFEVALQCPRLQDCYQSVTDAYTTDAYLRALAALACDQHIGCAISTVHLPFWAPLTRALRAARGWRIHYDCMDEWIDFPGIGAPLLQQEQLLVAEADLVTVTAAALLRKWSSVNPRCELVRNGVDFDYFAAHCAPNRLLDVAGPVVGFYGALAEWVDFALLAQIATRRPDWTLVLVGDVFVPDLAGLDALPNVILTGKRPYAQMPLFLYRFDVCLIPFVQNDVTHAVDPVKFYEYLSAGKPVVSVPLEELQIHREHLYFAADAAGFERQIERALAETELGPVQRRVALARDNDWKQRFTSTHHALRAIHPRVSIIVVSFDNAGLTRQCIDSVFRNTAHPNFEVIVVDNASRDDSRNYLRWLARTRPEVQVVLNADNVGFAAANNQGLRIASGDIVVLLNNDTVVPKSWLDPLLRALEDPDIGMVGPVTNAVGNEARVAIDSEGIDGVQAFADRRRDSHAGRMFDIPMLAMFCVALRRDTVQRVGMLDEAFGIGLFEDDDYSRRVQACGLRTVCVEDAFLHHYGQASFKKLIAGGEYQRLWERNQALFERKWGQWTPHRPRASEVMVDDGDTAPLAAPDASDAAAKQATADHWSRNVAGSDAFSSDVYWLAVPAVQARHQRLGSGGRDYGSWVDYCVGDYLRSPLPVARMLSLGCGSGSLERHLSALGAFVACDAIDLAPGALEIARREAVACGASGIDYRELDLEHTDLPAAHYDAAWFNGSLHHIEALERVLCNVRQALKPDGWLFFNEYVGANHFGFGNAQREAISRVFAAIPPKYRRSFVAGSWGEVQEAVPLPDPDAVRRVDPSEAVRSQDILRVVDSLFDVQACHACGGTLLQFLLHGIAGNFRVEDPESMQVLAGLFWAEDELIASGVLTSDFVVVVARPRQPISA